MCNFDGNLIAWMDGELSSEIASDVERHVRSCGDCRQRLAKYENVSRDFAAYYLTKNQPVVVPANRVTRWVPYAAAAAAAILLVSSVFVLRRPNKIAPEVRESAKVISPAQAQSHVELSPAVPVASKPIARHRVPPHQSRPEEASPTQTAIQIAIPAEAMFPPGAVPQGMAYIASLAPDGSIQSIRLQP